MISKHFYQSITIRSSEMVDDDYSMCYLEHALLSGHLPELDDDQRVQHRQYQDGSKPQQDLTQDDVRLKI